MNAQKAGASLVIFVDNIVETQEIHKIFPVKGEGNTENITIPSLLIDLVPGKKFIDILSDIVSSDLDSKRNSLVIAVDF